MFEKQQAQKPQAFIFLLGDSGQPPKETEQALDRSEGSEIALGFQDAPEKRQYPTVEEALKRGWWIDDDDNDVDLSELDGSANNPYPRRPKS